MKKYRFTLLLFSIFIAACVEHSSMPKPPLILPFSIEKAGSVLETELRIVETRDYIFSLRFFYKEHDRADRERVEKLVGREYVDKQGKALKPGIPTPVRLTIFERLGSENKLIFEKEIDPLLTSWGGSNFDKTMAFVVLPPGQYQVGLENLKDAPELSTTMVALAIGYDHKSKQP